MPLSNTVPTWLEVLAYGNLAKKDLQASVGDDRNKLRGS
jgi:hypothetical protein